MWEILTVDGKISTLDEKRAIFRIILRNLLQFLNQIQNMARKRGKCKQKLDKRAMVFINAQRLRLLFGWW